MSPEEMESVEERTFMIDSDPWAFLPPKQRDEYYMQNYGMTFAEYQKANPPPTDEEIHKLIMENIKA